MLGYRRGRWVVSHKPKLIRVSITIKLVALYLYSVAVLSLLFFIIRSSKLRKSRFYANKNLLKNFREHTLRAVSAP